MAKLNFNKGIVELAHGAGGRAMHQLLEELIHPMLSNTFIEKSEDQAILPQIIGEIAFTTDSYVVKPYFFPGGDIGSLAVHGTINDLAVGGAIPLYLSLGLILEEGLPLSHLKTIIESVARSVLDANVQVVTGDLKVVEKGKGDAIFINMSGVGILESQNKLSYNVKLGDQIIINGNIAEHGVAVMAGRDNLSFTTNIISDSCALNGLINNIQREGFQIKCMRDPTRGGIAATLHEWAHKYKIGITIYEKQIPINSQVEASCELLGLDPLFIANEGKVLIVCDREDCDKLLSTIKSHPHGIHAKVIGEVTSIDQIYVNMHTNFGGIRKIDWLNAEQLPRIC